MNGASLRVAVIGGGIGGLTAALSLRQGGFEVEVYEQAPELTQIGGGTEARFENGARITADALVGADGIHSTVRSSLFGEEAPRFAGCVAYRGLVPVERIGDLALDTGNQSWVGPGAHLVHYPVARG